jgi:hypothetical protein
VHVLPLIKSPTPSYFFCVLPLTAPSFANPPSHFLCVWDRVAIGYLIPTFDAHCVLSPKTTLTMSLRRIGQCLHLDEGLPQASKQNQHPFQQLPTQNLPTITKVAEHPTFDNIPEVQLHQVNMSTTTAGTSQNGRGTSSTQTSGGDQHLNTNPPPPPPPPQVNQDEAESNQIKIEDWDEEDEDEAEAEENELIRVQQEIDRLQ